MAILRLAGTKQGAKAYIGVKVAGQKEPRAIINPETKKPVSSIEARIINAKVDEFTFEGDTTHALSLTIEQGTKRHYFNLGYSFLAISIFNSVLGMSKEQLENVSISVYQDKETGKNKVYITSHGQRVEWAITKEEMDTLVELTKDKKGNVVATDKTLLTKRFQSIIATKEFPKALVQMKQANALDFLDDDEDDNSNSKSSFINEEDEDLAGIFDGTPASTPKQAPKDEEIHIDSIPF